MKFLSARAIPANIAWQMSWRSIQQRYRGSVLGLAWAVMTPLLMLVVYTFIFTKVFDVRWGEEVGDGTVGGLGTLEFAVVLFAGLSLYAFLSEVLTGASSVIIGHQNYVKKIVFPLRILPVVTVATSLFQLVISVLILVAFQFVLTGSLPLTTPLAAIPLGAFVVMMTGFAWWMAALGTYLRDINQVLTPIVTAALFLGPILYPMSVFNEAVRPWLVLNPVTVPAEALRDALIWGNQPDWAQLGIFSAVALVIFVSGWKFFDFTRGGFADVL